MTISPDQSTGIASYTFNAYYTSTSSLSGAGRASADISEAFAMTPDTRTVILHRTGAVGETVDPNGTVHGDTIYSCDSFVSGMKNVTETFQPNWQVFSPTYIGKGTPGWGWVWGEDHWGLRVAS